MDVAKWIIMCALIICGGLNPISSQGPSDPAPSLSMFALKLRGACTKPQLLEEFLSSCPKSAITVEPDELIRSIHPQVSTNAVIEVKKQKDLVMLELINRALHNSKVPTHQPKFGTELLSTVVAIYGKACPVIPSNFLQTVYHLFTYTHWITAHNRKEYLPKDQQKWLMKIVNNCTIGMNVPRILTDSCKETVLNMHNCNSFICTEKAHEFRLKRTDPIADAVFKTMEMVQSICFPVFTESYRMFHFFHLAVMDMFTEEIKTRWTTQLEESSYWKRLLGPSYETHLMNLERCNEGIIAAMKFRYRISRSSLPARIRLAGAVRSKKNGY